MLGPLHFAPIFMERVWGGSKLGPYLKADLPGDGPVGEAWLVSDHASAESIVDTGPHEGRSLRSLLEEDAQSILGRLATLTPHGRFPLLLKVLDSGAPLSVQVHPDDDCAARLGERDVGKTEMWHVIESEAGAELICGLDPKLDAAGFQAAVERGSIEDAMERFAAAPGDSVFVSAGTVHAIGAGVLLAEIQQNSDVTYRIYDYDRAGPDGKRRELHLDKAAKAIRFGSAHFGKSHALDAAIESGTRSVLAACGHFAAERIEFDGAFQGNTRGDSFHIVMSLGEDLCVETGGGDATVARGHAVLIASGDGEYAVKGRGALLIYYVPDLARDVVQPLRAAGHSDEAIAALGGEPAISDIAKVLYSRFK